MAKFRFFTSITIASMLLISTLLTSVGAVGAESFIQAQSNEDRIYMPDELIVQFKENKTDFNSQQDVTITAEFSELGLALIKVPEGELEQYKNSLDSDENVKSVQYNYIYKPLDLSNDPFSNWQWGLHNTGQTVEGSEGQIVEDIDINLPEAWKLIENKDEKLAEVVVAVLDDGVQTNHPDLKNSIWVNAEEISNNGIDDDGNGYIDDVNGWDFYNGDHSIEEGYHGTHLAGTIAAANNEMGIAGIAANVKLMPLKFIHDNEGGNVWYAIEGIRYAEKNGAKMVIASWGSKYHSAALEQAIKASKMLFVTAAGNDNNNNDGPSKNYPSSYDSDNIISVGAIDKNGEKAYFSNYGTKSVDVVAPGVSIYSTVPTDKYGFAEGTSMAAAHVAGVAALLAGVEEKITPEEIKQVLTVTGKKVEGAKNTVSGKMLDAYSALAYYIVSLPLNVDQIYDSSRYITGSTEPEAIVRVENKMGNLIVGGQADQDGKFKFLLSERLPTNTELIIYSKKGLINSQEIEMLVKHDDVKPVLVEGSLDVTSESEKLEGIVSEYASVYIKIGNQEFSSETNEDGSFSFVITPFAKDTKGEYILKDLADPSNTTTGSFVVKDHAVPELISNEPVNDMSTIVKGQVSKAATVQLKVGTKVLHSKPVQTDEEGYFEIKIPRQKMGDVITVIMVDDRGQKGQGTIDVLDGTGPIISKLSTVYETSRNVEGYVNEDSTITIYKSVDGKVWELLTEDNKLSALANEPFTFELPIKLAKGNKIKIVAKDAFENESKETILTVQQDRTAPKLVDPDKIRINDKGENEAGDTFVSGKLSEEATVTVLDGSKATLVEEKTDEYGIFTITIPKRKAKEKLTFVFEDTAPNGPNTSKVTVTVTDETNPEIKEVNTVYNSSRVITGVISEAGKVTATVKQLGKEIKITSSTAKKRDDENYEFTITMKQFQEVGTTIELQATDSRKHQSEIKSVTVEEDTSKATLDGELIITDSQTSVKGKVTKEATVQLFVGDQPLHKSAVKTDASGNFRITIKKQKAGTEITVKINDYVENSSEVTVTVIDKTNPVVSKVDAVYHTSKSITGKVSEQATVTVYRNNTPIGSVETDEDGAFSIPLKTELVAKEKLVVLAEDSMGLTSKSKSITVRKDTVAPKIELTEVISVSTTEIKGQLNEAGKVSVSSKGFPTIGFINTKEDGSFTVTLSGWSLTKGQTITITAEDMIGNKKNYKFKVVQ